MHLLLIEATCYTAILIIDLLKFVALPISHLRSDGILVFIFHLVDTVCLQVVDYDGEAAHDLLMLFYLSIS